MRAIECPVPGCLHIHAPNDEDLIELVLRHTHQAHPATRMDETAAEKLVDDGGYDDRNHRQRKGFFNTIADTGGLGSQG